MMQTMTLQGAATVRTAGSAEVRAGEAARALAERVKAWLKQESESFSLLTGEKVTRMDVVKAHLGLMGAMALILLGGLIEKGGAL